MVPQARRVVHGRYRFLHPRPSCLLPMGANRVTPMASTDRCMNARLFRDAKPCTSPTYWTHNPTFRLCRECFVALFGREPDAGEAS